MLLLFSCFALLPLPPHPPLSSPSLLASILSSYKSSLLFLPKVAPFSSLPIFPTLSSPQFQGYRQTSVTSGLPPLISLPPDPSGHNLLLRHRQPLIGKFIESSLFFTLYHSIFRQNRYICSSFSLCLLISLVKWHPFYFYYYSRYNNCCVSWSQIHIDTLFQDGWWLSCSLSNLVLIAVLFCALLRIWGHVLILWALFSTMLV